MSPDRSKFHFDQGLHYFEQGDHEHAISLFKEAVLENPQFHEALYNLACCLAITENKDDALVYLVRACKLSIHCTDWAKDDKEFDSIRDVPVFRKVVYGEKIEGETTEESDATLTPQISGLQAVIETFKGNIQLILFSESVPFTTANFVNLARRGFYDNLSIHRVVMNFMIQGGCPLGTGKGGPGYKFKDEFVSELSHDKPGTLSMANSGPDANGSQFFITHKATPWLDQKHTVFGEVMGEDDQEVVNNIVQGDRIKRIIIEGDLTELLSTTQSKIDRWDKILNKKFPNLRNV